jgi:hypothetical protein
VAGVAIDLEGFGLTSAAIQRQHQLGAQALAVRMLTRQPGQLGDQLGVSPEGEVGGDPGLDRSQPALLEDLGLRCDEWGVGDVLQRASAPHGESLADHR